MVIQPIDYSIDIQKPFEAAAEGYKAGNMFYQASRQRELEDQQQAEQQRIRQMQEAIVNKPINQRTAKDYADLAMFVAPKQSEAFLNAWGAIDKEQQLGSQRFAGQAMAAFHSGNHTAGVELLRQRAEAEKNSGNSENAQMYDTWAKIAETNPEYAATSIGTLLAMTPEGDKVLKGVTDMYGEKREQEMQPLEMAGKEAELAKTQAEIGKTVADTEKSIAEGSKTKKEMEYGTPKEQRQQRADEAAFTSMIGTLDNTLGTINRILKTDPSTIKQATGTIQGSERMPTFGQKTANFEALVNNLKSQAFMAEITNMVGKGALSDAEGKKIESALQNLSLKQSPEQLMRNIRIIQSKMTQERVNLAKQYKSGSLPVQSNSPASSKLDKFKNVKWD